VSPPLAIDESPEIAARVWHLRAVTAEARGELEEADRSMSWAVRMNRNNPWIHIAQGRYLERQGRVDEALEAYENANSLGGSPEVFEALGLSLFRLGQDAEAIAALEKAGNEGAYARLSQHFMEAGDKLHADLIFQKWSAWEPNEQWLEVRVKLANWLGLQPGIWGDYVALLSASPDLDAASQALSATEGACAQGAVWKWAKENRAASRGAGWRKWATAVAESSGDGVWYGQLLKQRAIVDGEQEPLLAHLHTERRFDSLREQALSWLDSSPESVAAREYLGAAYRGMNRYDEAISEWEAVLADDPTAERALRMLIGLRVDQGLSAKALALAEGFAESTQQSITSRSLFASVVAETGALERAVELARALPEQNRAETLVEIFLEAGEWERAWTTASEADDLELMLQVAEHDSGMMLTQRSIEVWTELQQRGAERESNRALYALNAMSLEEALRREPCEPALLKEAWEEGASCEQIVYLGRAYTGFPAVFSDSYSRAAARCDLWPEALDAAQWALRIEDSEARRRHLDYVQQAAEKFKRARRKP